MCITERQTVMDKELDYGQTEERDRKKVRAGKTGTYIFLTFWALVVLFPFYWMLLTSVKSYGSYNAEHIPKLFTLSPTLQNRWENTCSIR